MIHLLLLLMPQVAVWSAVWYMWSREVRIRRVTRAYMARELWENDWLSLYYSGVDELRGLNEFRGVLRRISGVRQQHPDWLNQYATDQQLFGFLKWCAKCRVPFDWGSCDAVIWWNVHTGNLSLINPNRPRTATLIIQVNGKLTDQMWEPEAVSKNDLIGLAKSRAPVQNAMKDKVLRKVVVVPHKIINFVTE